MLPREITSEHWPDRTSYDFPQRPIGALRYLGLLPMAFSALFVSLPGYAALRFWQQAAEGKGGIPNLILSAFLCVFILAGLVPFALGLFVLAGRTRLVAGGDRITITEIAGPVRRRRKIRFADVARLEVRSGPKSVNQSPGSTSIPLSALGALIAVLRDGKSRPLLAGYPREWLDPVAGELSGLMRLTGAEVEVKSIAGLKEEESKPLERNVPKPESSQVQVDSRVNGFVMQIPLAGLRRGSRAMLAIGLFWCLVLTVICAVLLAKQGAHRVRWPVWLIFAGFWSVGLGLLAGALNMGRRRTTFWVEGGSLRLEQHGPFGARKMEWRPGEIASVLAGPSGMTVNNVPILQLQICPVKGKKVRLLSGRAEDELRWIACELREALGLEPAQKIVDDAPGPEKPGALAD